MGAVVDEGGAKEPTVSRTFRYRCRLDLEVWGIYESKMGLCLVNEDGIMKTWWCVYKISLWGRGLVEGMFPRRGEN